VYFKAIVPSSDVQNNSFTLIAADSFFRLKRSFVHMKVLLFAYHMDTEC
jgi:hypothetical protein